MHTPFAFGRGTNVRMLLSIIVCSILSFSACGPAQRAEPSKQQTDSEAEGLKGRVKTVVTEYANVTREAGASVEGKRRPFRTDYYDENGNLTRSLVYDSEGNLTDTFDFFFLGGERVYKTSEVQSKDGPPEAVAPPGPQRREQPDQGYDVKLIYKHDARGNRVEELQYQNDGTLEGRVVSEYDGKGLMQTKYNYGPGGGLGTSSAYTYDDKGVVTGEVVRVHEGASRSTVSHRYSYTYEFDARGNWIKRNESDAADREPSPTAQPTLVSYRTITYY